MKNGVRNNRQRKVNPTWGTRVQAQGKPIREVWCWLTKINETLESILKAYEKRLTADTVIPPKLKEYPSPIQEKVNLVKHHALIRDTQTMLEGPPSYSVGKLPMHVPDLEVIHEDSKNGSELNIENGIRGEFGG